MYIKAGFKSDRIGSDQVASSSVPPHPILFALHADEFEATMWVRGRELGAIYYVHV